MILSVNFDNLNHIPLVNFQYTEIKNNILQYFRSSFALRVSENRGIIISYMGTIGKNMKRNG